jgi:hypothetical protein
VLVQDDSFSAYRIWVTSPLFESVIIPVISVPFQFAVVCVTTVNILSVIPTVNTLLENNSACPDPARSGTVSPWAGHAAETPATLPRQRAAGPGWAGRLPDTEDRQWQASQLGGRSRKA